MTHCLPLDMPAIYHITVGGYVSRRLADNLDLAASVSGGSDQTVTTLTGRVMDQAALMGILNSLYDLGYPLLSVEYKSSP